MRTERWPFHGMGRARALTLDTPVIGEPEARRRVLEHWRPGATVGRLPDGRWLLVLPDETDWRADRAPGLPCEVRDGLVQLDVAGRREGVDPGRLPGVGVHDWWRPDGLGLVLMTPADEPLRPEPVEPPPPPARADLRAAARSRRGAPGGPGSPGGPGGAAPRRGSDWLARLALRTPAGDAVRRRHARYLAELTGDFAANRLDDALRKAIALGGEGAAALLSLQLPTMRLGPLRAASATTGGGRSLAVGGPDVRAHLTQLYRDAAERLEHEGRIDEAAFVLADLLMDVSAAVRLLERHGRLPEAAALAEARQPDAAMAVRLWWLAGERDRAVRLARARGAFAEAVVLLGPVDRAASRALRAEWVAALRASGDRLGAVEVAWPEESLRPTVLADLAAGMALGGPVAAQLFAYLVTYRPTVEARDAALALLDGVDAGHTASRDAFVRALTELTSADPAHDRALSGAALRALTRGSTALPAADAKRAAAGLRARADPLLVSDLAPLVSSDPGPGTLHVGAVGVGSPVPVLDAAVVGGGVLVALGDLGVRLLTRDGRTAARWNVPADRLVVADHGGTVLLGVGSGEVVDLHRLDVATRQVRRWATVRLRALLPSFDGGLLVGQDAEGLVWLDTTGPRPRVAWRELDAGTQVHAVSRSPEALAALVTSSPPGWPSRVEIMSWKLPKLRLTGRRKLPPERMHRFALTPAGGLLSCGDPGPGGTRPTLARYEGQQRVAQRDASGDLFADGGVEAEVIPSGAGRWSVQALGRDLTPVAVLTLPSPPRLRGQGRVLLTFDGEGRVVAVDLARRAVLANLRVPL
jgi:hypothetical protein